jgi:monofunctional biosynthetic peptidoglycan transglycosylase
MGNRPAKKIRKNKKRSKLSKILRLIFIKLPLIFFGITFLWILLLKWFPVYVTPLMLIRSVEYIGDDTYHTYKTWKPISKISDNMVLAVMASEDNKFLSHNGFDWEAIDKVIDMNKRGRRLRGASTISQQTAKNVFLFPSRTWLRKGLEVYFTFGIEIAWSKKRIMEVYLNVIEMGKGIYGAEAAAREMFNKPAAKLTAREASLIAAVLPNPMKRRADTPSGYVSGRASRIQNRMYQMEIPYWFDSYKPTGKKIKK